MTRASIGVIGGSGLYGVQDLEVLEEVSLTTPFGDPSAAVLIGRWQGVPVAFLPRHGRGHRIMPTDINARANIFALKTLGVEWLISVSAVGSMREAIVPGDIVIPDQFFDRTTARPSTFFHDGIVAPSPTRSAPSSATFCIAPPSASGHGCIGVGPTCASRDRSFPPRPSRASTANGASMSLA
jgi:purine nucleoside phosphorylase